MSTTVLFEHPLNEKMRTWLRIEFLLKQLSASQNIVDHLGALTFSAMPPSCWTCLSVVNCAPKSLKSWSVSSKTAVMV